MSPSGIVEVLPRYDVVERHERLVRASPWRTEAAFRAMTLREVPLMGLLFAARSLPARLSGHGSGLPSTPEKPLLEQFLSAGFGVLHERPGEIVVGVIAQMWRPGGQVVRPSGLAHFAGFGEPGFVKAALSFAVTDEGGVTRAVTETRVAATDAHARQAFARYWLVIGPFSGLVRRIWLRGLAARAEFAQPPLPVDRELPAAQALLVAVFASAGLTKVAVRKERLGAPMPWVEDFSQPVVRVIGALEIIGALGVAGPAALGRLRWLTPLAATGLALVMVGGFATHVRRGEFARSSTNIVLCALAEHVARTSTRSLRRRRWRARDHASEAASCRI